MPRLLGLSCKDYIRTFHRVNLIRDSEDEQSWDGRLARAAAEALVTSRPGGLILALGSRVRNAFCSAARVRAGNQPEFFHGERRRVSANCDPTWILFLPHPSGRNRMWNDRDNIAKLRSTINHWAPGLVPLEVT